MDYQELIDDLKGRINPQYVDCMGTESYERKQCLEAIESLLAENERLNAELAKYRDAPVVAYRHLMEDGWEYFDAPTGDDCPKCVPLIVKPDENK